MFMMDELKLVQAYVPASNSNELTATAAPNEYNFFFIITVSLLLLNGALPQISMEMRK